MRRSDRLPDAPQSADSDVLLEQERETPSPSGQIPTGLTFGGRVVSALGVGAMLSAAFPPFHLPCLLPFAVALLLWLLIGVTVRQAAYIGLACGLVFFGGSLFWLTNIFGQAAISLWASAAAFPMLFCALLVWLQKRLPRLPLWLLAPTLWTGIEVFRSEWMRPDFGFLGLGYALVDTPLLAACAALFGSYGLTFGIVALGAALRPNTSTLFPGAFQYNGSTLTGEGESKSESPPSLLRPQAEVLREGGRGVRLLLLALWIVLLFLPRPTLPPERPITVRLVQAPSDDEDSLFALSKFTLQSRADLLLWPEYSLSSDPSQDARLWKRLTTLPQENRCYFLFGAKDQFDPRSEAAFRNTAFLFDAEGRLVGKHVKNHLVHFVRDGVKGTEARAFSTTLGKLGIAICFDMDYPDVARRLVQDGAEVLLVPSDNPMEWGPVQRAQHRQMFQMRALDRDLGCGRQHAHRCCHRSRNAASDYVGANVSQRAGRARNGPNALCAWGMALRFPLPASLPSPPSPCGPEKTRRISLRYRWRRK